MADGVKLIRYFYEINMKKLLLLLTLMGVVSCSKTSTSPSDAGCSEASCPIHLDAGTTDINDIITEDNWQFTLPGEAWRVVNPPDDTIRAIFLNEDLGAVIFFAKEATTDSYPDYVVGALRSFKSGGMTIASAKQVSVNGKSFLAITANGTNRTIWSWITVYKGFGYAFSCAVEDAPPDAGTSGFDRCNDIANTLDIQ